MVCRVSYALLLLILGSCYTAHKCIVNIMKVYIKSNNIQVELIRFRKMATLLTFETMKWGYIFATDVLIAIRDESPLVCRSQGAPGVSEHSHFGTCHIGTTTMRDCTTQSCQLSGFWTESPTFSSHQNLRPRRLKSPSFEHRRIFFSCFWDII